VPHFDNAEGGSYDTRYCYLGETRLRAMEALLPDDVGVLGVDEHTALLVDTAAGTATVSGNGVVSLRYRDRVVELEPGRTVDVGWVADVVAGRGPAEPGAAPPAPDAAPSASGPTTPRPPRPARQAGPTARAAVTAVPPRPPPPRCARPSTSSATASSTR
jgi:hypothetical protein